MSSLTPSTRPIPAERGAEATAAAWYAEFGPAVYKFLRFNLPSADLAEDVTAETFLKVFRSLDRFDPRRGSPRVWIFQIAQNTLRDQLRRLRVRPQVPLGAMRDLASDAPSPEERLLWEEEVGRLLAALGELADADRELISLRYGSALDITQIAELLGVRESVVRTRLWRAVGRLRRRLVEDQS